MKIETKLRTVVQGEGPKSTLHVFLDVIADGEPVGCVTVVSGKTELILDLDPETTPLNTYAARLGF
jgi:hypothetical protein